MVSPELSADRLLAGAESDTGLSDWGDIDVAAPLGWLCESLEEQADLNDAGRRFASSRLSLMLRNRLTLVADRRQRPEIADQAIVRPVIILGLPRSGTTLLFNLLAQDPAHRSPMAWEVFFPSPPVLASSSQAQIRIAETNHLLARWGMSSPAVMRVHPFGASLPEECATLFEPIMQHAAFNAFWNVPAYAVKAAALPKLPAIEEHRRFLQHLQSAKPADRWLLKSPAHLADLAEVSTIYPDALFVQTHRDVGSVVPSYTKLYEALRGLSTDNPDLRDPRRVLDGLLERLSLRLGNAEIFRATEAGSKLDFVDLRYADLVRDPLAAVGAIYERLDAPLTAETGERMRTWLATNRQGKHGANRYSLAELGIERGVIDRLFGEHMRRYDVPVEIMA